MANQQVTMKKILLITKKILKKLFLIFSLLIIFSASFYLFNFYWSANKKAIKIIELLNITPLEKVELEKAQEVIGEFQLRSEVVNIEELKNPFIIKTETIENSNQLPTTTKENL